MLNMVLRLKRGAGAQIHLATTYEPVLVNFNVQGRGQRTHRTRNTRLAFREPSAVSLKPFVQYRARAFEKFPTRGRCSGKTGAHDYQFPFRAGQRLRTAVILIPSDSHKALIPSMPPSLCQPRSETFSTPSTVSKSQQPRSVQTSSAFLHSGIICNSTNSLPQARPPALARGAGRCPGISRNRFPAIRIPSRTFHRGHFQLFENFWCRTHHAAVS